jgi:hypothetical protein
MIWILPTVDFFLNPHQDEPPDNHNDVTHRNANKYFLPSPRRYSSGWALASWIIGLHFFICSDDEASCGRMKKWEECGWKRSWPTYFRWFYIHSIYPRVIIWFLNNLVFTVWGCYHQSRGPGYPSSSGFYPLICPAWVPLAVATLPPA